MPREQFQTLTEAMYYILLCLVEECCGVDIMENVKEMTDNRICLGPGTVYTLLGKFESEGMIRETDAKGRKRWYRITDKGRSALVEEYSRLKQQLEDGRGILHL